MHGVHPEESMPPNSSELNQFNYHAGEIPQPHPKPNTDNRVESRTADSLG